MAVTQGDLVVDVDRDFVATVELQRPPNNFFDTALIAALADAYEALDQDPACRAVVLCSAGKHFCAGADFAGSTSAGLSTGQPAAGESLGPAPAESPALAAGESLGPAAGSSKLSPLYTQAMRLFATAKPVVAAVHGAAIGGGLGLACSADFRVGAPESRFSANFAQLGFHHGFGLTVTLPAIVGQQNAADLLYTGRRIGGDEAFRVGLCDRLTPLADVRAGAHRLAAEMASAAPMAVRSIRRTLRSDLAGRVGQAMVQEGVEQDRLRLTADWREGVRAAAERRQPRFEEG